MSLVAVTTVVRRAPPDEHSSFLRLVDLERRRVAATVAVPDSPFRAADPNPRGGSRGARGVSAWGERLVVATNDRLFVLDSSWRLVGELTHPWLGGIHDVLADEGGIWVTSTAASLLARLSWEGALVRSWRWAEDPGLARALGFNRPPAFDPSLDYRAPFPGIGVHDTVHLNAVAHAGSRLLVGLGLIRPPAARRARRLKSAVTRAGSALPVARGLLSGLRGHRRRHREMRGLPAPRSWGSSHAIVEIELEDGRRPGPARPLWRQRGIRTPKHNALLAGHTLLFNDSDAGELTGVDLETGRVAVRVGVPGSPSFVRGLCVCSDQEVIVGGQRPAAIYVAHLGTRSITEAIELGAKPWETVHAICTVPDDFSTGGFEGFREWAVDHSLPSGEPHAGRA